MTNVILKRDLVSRGQFSTHEVLQTLGGPKLLELGDVRHIFDYESKLTEPEKDTLFALDSGVYGKDKDLYTSNSRYLILNKDTSSGELFYTEPAHTICVGGYAINGDKRKNVEQLGGVFTIPKNNLSRTKLEESEMFLDWNFQAGVGASIIYENSIEEVKANGWHYHFHADAPSNVLGNALIGTRLPWEDHSALTYWVEMVSKFGVHPWVARQLCEQVTRSTSGHYHSKGNSYAGGHSTFYYNMDFDAYKAGQINYVTKDFREHPVLSYNKSGLIWNRDISGTPYHCLKGIKPKKAMVKNVNIFEDFFLSKRVTKNIIDLTDKDTVAHLNSGLCPRIVERTTPFLDKYGYEYVS